MKEDTATATQTLPWFRSTLLLTATSLGIGAYIGAVSYGVATSQLSDQSKPAPTLEDATRKVASAVTRFTDGQLKVVGVIDTEDEAIKGVVALNTITTDVKVFWPVAGGRAFVSGPLVSSSTQVDLTQKYEDQIRREANIPVPMTSMGLAPLVSKIPAQALVSDRQFAMVKAAGKASEGQGEKEIYVFFEPDCAGCEPFRNAMPLDEVTVNYIPVSVQRPLPVVAKAFFPNDEENIARQVIRDNTDLMLSITASSQRPVIVYRDINGGHRFQSVVPKDPLAWRKLLEVVAKS